MTGHGPWGARERTKDAKKARDQVRQLSFPMRFMLVTLTICFAFFGVQEIEAGISAAHVVASIFLVLLYWDRSADLAEAQARLAAASILQKLDQGEEPGAQ